MSNDIAAIDKQIAELQEKRKKAIADTRADVLKRIKDEIVQFEFTASEIGIKSRRGRKGGAKKTTKAKAVAKYQNPSNIAETWVGRGKPPKWLIELVKKGARKEDFLIVNK